MTIYDPDILKAELVILTTREEELMLELEEIRATIGMYQNEMEVVEQNE